MFDRCHDEPWIDLQDYYDNPDNYNISVCTICQEYIVTLDEERSSHGRIRKSERVVSPGREVSRANYDKENNRVSYVESRTKRTHA